MTARLISAAALIAGSLCAQAQTPDLRTGGWNMTDRSQGTGGGIPDAIGNIAPAMRARLEASLTATMRPHTLNYKSCLRKSDIEELAGDLKKLEEDAAGNVQCDFSNVRRTSKHWEADVSCRNGISGHGAFDAAASDRVTGKLVMHIATDSGARDVTHDISGHWASASCKGFAD